MTLSIDKNGRGPRQKAVLGLALALSVFAQCLLTGTAAADSGPELAEIPLINANRVAEGGEEVGGPATDPEMAARLPHHSLSREEAIDLLQGVFQPELEAAAGPFDELDVEKFLSPNVALIAAGEQPEGDADSYSGPTLLNSTVPLRTSSSSTPGQPVDLGLQRAEGELQPANPLVPVGIPHDLSEGIQLPESEVRISLAGAPQEVSPTTVANSTAFYPNIALDTDLVVAPTPTGVETLTQLRSADAPRSQTFRLNLPSGTSLHAAQGGGAEVSSEGEPLIDIAPASAIDATGAAVPVQMSVGEEALTLTVSPEDSSQYPILLDPLYQSYTWAANKPQTGITGNTGYEQWSPEKVGEFSKPPFTTLNNSNGEYGEYGLYANSTLASAKTGDHAAWIYTVPRYFTDSPKPTSFISHMTLSGLTWWANSTQMSPYLKAGLWDIAKKEWVSLLSHEGLKEHSLTDTGFVYNFNNASANTEVKVGSIGLWAMESVNTYDPASIRATVATVELAEAEKDVPGFAPVGGPTGWVNQTASPFDFSVTDTGLGVYAVTISGEGKGAPSWKTKYGCTGVAGNACPRIWSKYSSGHPLTYEPAALPQGIDTLSFVAEDPLGHVSTPALAQIKVDHTGPTVALSGSLIEKGPTGLNLPTYMLKADAADGSEAAPQSGVAKVVTEIDGKVVKESSPGCGTKNCSLSLEWQLQSGQYAAGSHTVKVIATDAVGISTTKTLSIELVHPLPPSVALSGSITEQANLGSSRPRYMLNVSAGTEGAKGAGSAITTAVSVDGVNVDGATKSCTTTTCSLSDEWAMSSPSYADGKHAVQVKATDALGWVTTKTLLIQIQKDTTKPTLEVSGGLFEAPGGWVEQGKYGLTAKASDSGYGVTSLTFRVDGKVVSTTSQSCADGGCDQSLLKTIDMSAYTGGAHSAELTATDGAGNTSTTSWTPNINPGGEISAGEAADTLEAVDETSESTVLSSTAELISPEERADGNDPHLEEEGEELVSTGTPNVSVIAGKPSEGFEIGMPEATIQAEPVTSGGDATPVHVVNGAAGIAANTGSGGGDLVLRPVFNGLMAFQAIRDKSASQAYSWLVRMFEGQTLHLIDEQTAEVDFEDGTPALTITAEPAHDAIGTTVPTTLSVEEEKIVTLHVLHQSGNYVYPVVAGQGWAGGFSTEIVARPKDEQEIRIEREQREREEREQREREEAEWAGGQPVGGAPGEKGIVGPPIPLPPSATDDGGASASSAGRQAYIMPYSWDQCAWDGPGGCDASKVTILGRFEYNKRYAWWKAEKPHPMCPYSSHAATITIDQCDWVGKNHQQYGGGYHISSRVLYHISGFFGFTFSAPEHLTMYMYGDGYAHGHNTEALCNPLSVC